MSNPLIFIYNADAGMVPDVTGAVKKALTGTSGCTLCNATYGVATEKQDWKTFRKSLTPTPIFYHRNEIPTELREYLKKETLELPIIVRQAGKGYEVILSTAELATCDGSSECLINLLTPRV